MADSLLQRAVAAVGPEELVAGLTREQQTQLYYDWPKWARPEQLAPDGDWSMWLILAGRGFGKTRTAVEWLRQRIESGAAKRIIIAGPTASDLRTDMILGESGIMARFPPWCRPDYRPSTSMITWPTGAVAVLLSADEPERFRGKQADTVWLDEICAWRYPEAFEQLQFGMRLGDPRYCLTTTPKPSPLIRELVANRRTQVVRGSTFDNASNLSAKFLKEISARYDGTRLGRQELYGEILNDVEGALWTHDMIDRARIRGTFRHDFARVVVALDPAGSAKKTADEAGIIVAGVAPCSCRGKSDELHGFVLEDLSGRFSPEEMGRHAVNAYHHWQASRLVAEDNFGGQIVADLITLIDPSVAYKAVHASRGKIVRAEPIAAMYEQGKIHHVGGFAKLEDEMTTYTSLTPSSPGRLDALVWALTDLLLESPGTADSSCFSAGQRRGAIDDDDIDAYDDE